MRGITSGHKLCDDVEQFAPAGKTQWSRRPPLAQHGIHLRGAKPHREVRNVARRDLATAYARKLQREGFVGADGMKHDRAFGRACGKRSIFRGFEKKLKKCMHVLHLSPELIRNLDASATFACGRWRHAGYSSPMRILSALALVLGVSSMVRATTIVPRSEPDLARLSDAVVFGHVLEVRHVAEGGRAYTIATLEIIASARGPEPTSLVSLQVPGGIVAPGIMQHVAGSPTLEQGQLWLGFLNQVDGRYVPRGLSYGLWPVVRGRDGAFVVSRPAAGAAPSAALPVGVVSVDTEPVESVLARVRGYLIAPDAAPHDGVRR